MEDPIVHSHAEVEVPVVQVESRTHFENHEVISHDCDDRVHSTNVVENGASSHRAESINFLAKESTTESKLDPLMKKSSTWNIFTSNHNYPQSATTKASSPGFETDQSKLGAHDYIVHSDVSYHTYTHDLPRHSHALESPSKELDINELLKSVDEQIRRSTNHQAGDFAHHTTTTTTFEEHHSPVPMLNLHQSHVVEKSKKASHVLIEENAQNSGRDLSPSSKSIFLGKTWAQDTIVQPVHHSADAYLTSDVRNSLHLHTIDTKKDLTYDVLHTPHLQQNDTFQSPALVDVHFKHSSNLFETPKKSFASPTALYSDIHHSASNDYLQSESTAKLLADIKAEFLSPKVNETPYVSHTHHYQETPVRSLYQETPVRSLYQETPVRNLYQETPIRHLNIETPAHHHQPKDENESLTSTMKNMSGTISYIDDLISDLKHRHDKLNSRYSKTFGSDYDNHVHHTSSSSYTTGKAEEEKTKKATKAPQKPIQEKVHSKPKETHHSKENEYAWIKTLFAVLVIILLGVLFNQIISISQDLMQ